MTRYRITSVISGADCGTYAADGESGALDAWAFREGFRDYEAAVEAGKVEPGELRVREVQACGDFGEKTGAGQIGPHCDGW